MRRLVAIASRDDGQTSQWCAIAEEAGAEVRFVPAGRLGLDWHLSAIPGQSVLSSPDGDCFRTNDRACCWYLRLPTAQSQTATVIMWHLHNELTRTAYGCGNYFHAPGGEATHVEVSKLLHRDIWRDGARFPPTRAVGGSSPRAVTGSRGNVVKSISGQRSIAVLSTDPRLPTGAGPACPTMFQERVEGRPIKIHFYRTRRERWLVLAARATSSELDYRYDDDTEITPFAYRSEWLPAAERVFGRLGSRFFDVDLVIGQDDMAFLEINLGPVPTYYERHLFPGRFPYSSAVLRDWLMN